MPENQATRRTAVIIWCSIAAALTTFGLVAAVQGPNLWPNNQRVTFLAWLAAGMATFLVAVSRLIPRRLKARASAPDSIALTRTIIASALCEGGGLFGCVAWMLTGSTWAVVAMAIGLGGLLMTFPTETRWRELAGAGSADASRQQTHRMVR